MNERWDIEVQFIDAPLPTHKIYTYKGPQIIIGSSPGVGGMELRKPTIGPVHARIDCYAKGQVIIHAIEHHEVRVATHQHEDWSRIDPIYKPVPLYNGNAIYIGPLGQGVLFVFLQAKTFVWKSDTISSVVDANNQIDVSIARNTSANTIQISKYPPWFFVSLAGMVSVTVIAMVIRILGVFSPELPPIGPRFQGYNHYQNIDVSEEVELSLLQGFQGPFEDFVMNINAKEMAAQGVTDIPNLSSNPDYWDSVFYHAVLNSVKQKSYWKGFWKILDNSKDDYALVVDALRDAKLPEVFAGIPFQETQYQAKLVSFVCAAGIWQFMPETALRMNLTVKDCAMGVSGNLWSPTSKTPPAMVTRDAPYVSVSANGEVSCKIGSYSKGTYCRIDERVDVGKSTTAAIQLLGETFADKTLAESGSLVQATILAHNAGYDDSPFLGKIKWTNILPAYTRYMKNKKNGIRFYGDNICSKPATTEGASGLENAPAEKCKSVLHEETQHYGYNVVAFHFLAVCYYAKNYGGNPIFKDWTGYLDGYCKEVHAPERG